MYNDTDSTIDNKDLPSGKIGDEKTYNCLFSKFPIAEIC